MLPQVISATYIYEKCKAKYIRIYMHITRHNKEIEKLEYVCSVINYDNRYRTYIVVDPLKPA